MNSGGVHWAVGLIIMAIGLVFVAFQRQIGDKERPRNKRVADLAGFRQEADGSCDNIRLIGVVAMFIGTVVLFFGLT